MAKSTITTSALGLSDSSTDGTVMGSGPAVVTKKKVTPRVKKATTKLPPNPFIQEILDLANKQKKIDDRIEVLKEYRNDA